MNLEWQAEAPVCKVFISHHQKNISYIPGEVGDMEHKRTLLKEVAKSWCPLVISGHWTKNLSVEGVELSYGVRLSIRLKETYDSGR